MVQLQDKLYTSTQVADILGVSLRTLYRYMEDGKIESMRTASGRHRFTKDQILEFLNAGGANIVQENSIPGAPVQTPTLAQTQTQTQTQTPVGSASRLEDQPVPASQTPSTQRFSSPLVESREDTVQPVETVTTQNTVLNSPVVPSQTPEEDTSVDLTQSAEPASFTEDIIQSSAPAVGSSVPITQTHDEFATPQVKESEVQSSPAQDTTIVGEQTGEQVQDEEIQPDSSDKASEAPSNVRIFKSDYTDLIELARKIKDAAVVKDMEYAFTAYAGLSLHFPTKPFTCLNFYVNPEDLQVWKNELRLTSVEDSSEGNVGIMINTDIVFVPTKEIGGFKLVEDKVLMRDLSSYNEEELVRQFRQHLSSI